MAFLVRKINIEQWPKGTNKDFTCIENLSADTIIKEFNTSGNALSLWKIENESEIKEIGASFTSRFKTKQAVFRLILFPYELIDKNFQLEHTPKNADTAIRKFRNCHYDMCNLTYGSLGLLASIITKYTTDTELKDKYIKKIDVKESLQIIDAYRLDKEVDENLLGRYVKKELGLETDKDREIADLENKLKKLTKSK